MLESSSFEQIKKLLLEAHHTRLTNAVSSHSAANFSYLLDLAGDECSNEQWRELVLALQAQTARVMRERGVQLLKATYLLIDFDQERL